MNFSGTVRLSRTGWFLVLMFGLIIFFMYFGKFLSPNNDENKNLVDLKTLLIGAIEASELGGNKVIAGTNGNLHVKSKGKTLEGANDPVTDADFASHCEMYHSLQRAFPSVHIKSEEESSERGSCPESSSLHLLPPNAFPAIASIPSVYVDPRDVTIWIDPLDATKEYTEKLHNFVTTMVCVAVKGVAVLGVIHQPFMKHTSWAWRGTLLSPDLAVPSQHDPESPNVAVSISHKGQVEAMAQQAFGSGVRLSPAAGAGFKALEVAHGRADMYLHNTFIKKWDVCAGDAILSALGGRMSNLKNETLSYSYNSDVVNRDGLLASVHHHNLYISKIIAHENIPKGG